jgi:6-phosphogluconolactonase
VSVHWHSYATPAQASQACAKHIAGLIEEALSGEGQASIAVSGGKTPEPMFAALAAASLPWDRVHVFQVDERAVPPTDAANNYRTIEEQLVKPAKIPRKNMHRIASELRPATAAQRYVDDIREFFGLDDGEQPHFDIVHRGVGADCHTASLFPGEPLIEDREQIAAAVYVEKLSQWRITLLPGALVAARHTVFLVTGGDKAGAVRAIFQGPYDPMQCPAQIVSHHGRSVTWFLDEAARSLMD